MNSVSDCGDLIPLQNSRETTFDTRRYSETNLPTREPSFDVETYFNGYLTRVVKSSDVCSYIPELLHSEEEKARDKVLSQNNSGTLVWDPSVCSYDVAVDLFLRLKKKFGNVVSEDKVSRLLFQFRGDSDSAYTHAKLHIEDITFSCRGDNWEELEKDLFEVGLKHFGKQWRKMRELIKSKTIEEIYTYYYYWKNTMRSEIFYEKLYQENFQEENRQFIADRGKIFMERLKRAGKRPTLDKVCVLLSDSSEYYSDDEIINDQNEDNNVDTFDLRALPKSKPSLSANLYDSSDNSDDDDDPQNESEDSDDSNSSEESDDGDDDENRNHEAFFKADFPENNINNSCNDKDCYDNLNINHTNHLSNNFTLFNTKVDTFGLENHDFLGTLNHTIDDNPHPLLPNGTPDIVNHSETFDNDRKYLNIIDDKINDPDHQFESDSFFTDHNLTFETLSVDFPIKDSTPVNPLKNRQFPVDDDDDLPPKKKVKMENN